MATKKMIKILMCGNHSSNKGGMTSVINQILEYDWEQEYIEFTFIPTYKPSNAVVKISYFIVSYFKIIFNLIFNKPDIVHMHMSYKGSFTRKYLIHKLCKVFNVSDIIHLHGGYFEEWYNKSDIKLKYKIRKFLRECHTCIVLGYKWDLAVKRIESNANTVIVRNTVKIPQKTVKWDDECIKLLYMGVLVPIKHIEDLLAAIVVLKSKGLWEKRKLLIMGTGVEESNLKTYCIKNKIQKDVEFLGWISGFQKEAILQECQLSVLSSYNEGLPISILESISYGMPVVATNVGDMESAVRNGENGYLVNPGDIEGIAKRIDEVCNYNTFIKFSASSKIIAKKEFSDYIFYKKLHEIYDSIYHNYNIKKEDIKC